VLGIYATVLSLGFAFGPWLFAQMGSDGFLPFGVTFGLVVLAALPVLAAWKESPAIHSDEGEASSFVSYIWLVPTATAAVLVFGAVETGGFALFPVYGNRIGYSEADAALLLTMIGLGNVILQIPLGIISDRIHDRRLLLAACSAIGLAGMVALPFLADNWHLTAAMLFVWGGVVAGLYTIGLAHLGSRLTGRDLASANAAFVFCYGFGMLIGPQVIGTAWICSARRGSVTRWRCSLSPILRWSRSGSPSVHSLDFRRAIFMCRAKFSAPGRQPP
jgi:predicted MFS family arabinose efflux permease